jgi:hypothetical protein
LVGKTLFLLALPAHFPDGINSSLPFPRPEPRAAGALRLGTAASILDDGAIP